MILSIAVYKIPKLTTDSVIYLRKTFQKPRETKPSERYPLILFYVLFQLEFEH